MAIRMIPPISSAFILNRQPYRRASKMPSQDKVKETTPIISTVCHKLIFNRENDKPTKIKLKFNNAAKFPTLINFTILGKMFTFAQLLQEKYRI
jgi:hypothetical protein